jgi:hypothetical protein
MTYLKVSVMEEGWMKRLKRKLRVLTGVHGHFDSKLSFKIPHKWSLY